MGVPHPTLLNMGERISVGGVVGRIEKRIVLILLKRPPPTPIPTNLVRKVYGHDANHCFTLHLEL
jgi:hypothetical protein